MFKPFRELLIVKWRARYQVITQGEQIHCKFILIRDRASIHTSKKTKAYLRNQPEILVEELPAYAPQLNSEEYCLGNVKQHLKNARPECKEEIRFMLDRGFARLRRRPDLLLGFFHNAKLSVRECFLSKSGKFGE